MKVVAEITAPLIGFI